MVQQVAEVQRLIQMSDRCAESPVIVLAPHAGREVPEDDREAFSISRSELEAEQDRLVDHHTDSLARGIGESVSASVVVNTLSRFVVDVERFPDDREEMNAVGMGVFYSHGSLRQPIRSLKAINHERLMAFYEHYSLAVEALVARALEVHGRALIIDVHSYPSQPLPYELHSDERRPDLCLGFEQPHEPKSLVDAFHACHSPLEVVDNQPFHGSYVPLRFFGLESRVSSIMLEIRRDIYLQPTTLEPRGGSIDSLVEKTCQALEQSGWA
jgi:N-formylglutamate amidohydrolase